MRGREQGDSLAHEPDHMTIETRANDELHKQALVTAFRLLRDIAVLVWTWFVT